MSKDMYSAVDELARTLWESAKESKDCKRSGDAAPHIAKLSEIIVNVAENTFYKVKDIDTEHHPNGMGLDLLSPRDTFYDSLLSLAEKNRFGRIHLNESEETELRDVTDKLHAHYR